MPWTKLPALTQDEAGHVGCLNCGPRPIVFDADSIIAVGFGGAGVTRDGELVLDGERLVMADEECATGADAEKLAAADPDHDWRIFLDGPLSSAVYQRHGPGEWVLIEKGEGFA